MSRCSVPRCPAHVVALHFGAAHPLAGLMCIEHLLAAVRKPRCSAPACGASVALPGAATIAGLLCAGHVAQAVAPPAPKLELPEAPPLPTSAWRALCHCGRPGVTLTPGGQRCEAHRAPQPVPTRFEDPEAGVREDAIALAAVELGASVVWGAISTRDYGDAVPSVPCRPRRYARPPVRAVDADLDHDLIRVARAVGWEVRTRITELLDEEGSPAGAWACRMFARGGGLELDVEWRATLVAARFRAAWFRAGTAQPVELGARQVKTLLASTAERRAA